MYTFCNENESRSIIYIGVVIKKKKNEETDDDDDDDDERQHHQRVVERSSVRDEERGDESRSRAFRDERCRGCYFRGLQRQKHLCALCQSEERR